MSTNSPRAARSPWLLPAARPRLRGFAITRTHRNSARTRSRLPSHEALSTRITSQGTDGGLSRSERKHSSKVSPPFQLTTTALITGASTCAVGSGCILCPLVRRGRDDRGSIPRVLPRERAAPRTRALAELLVAHDTFKGIRPRLRIVRRRVQRDGVFDLTKHGNVARDHRRARGPCLEDRQ